MLKKTKKIWLVLAVGLLALAGCSRNQVPPVSPSDARFPAYTPLPAALAGLRGPGTGEVAPDFRYAGADGEAASLGDLRGKPVMLNFWASWCQPCREEMPLLQGVYDDSGWREKGLQFITISIDQDPLAAQRYMVANKYTFPVIFDVKQDIAEAYNVSGIPETFFINKNGVIDYKQIGAFPNRASLERALNKIVK